MNYLDDALSKPNFDALTVELTSPDVDAARSALRDALASVFGETQNGWTVRAVHESVPNAFDLIPPDDHAISVKQGFDLQYALREQPQVVFAQALFETYQSDIPEGARVADGMIGDAEALSRGGLIKISSDWDDLTDKEKNPLWVHDILETAAAWEKATGKGVRVGHPDSGYIPHIELDAERILRDLEKDFFGGDNDSRNPQERGGNHGLGTSSALLSGFDKFSDTHFVTGTAPAAEIIPMRITRGGPPIFFTRTGPRYVRDAVYHAIDNDCHVISMSLGGVGDWSLHRALQIAVEKNLIVLAAAGNVVKIVPWPARYPEVIAVAGCTAERERWVHSCRGRVVDVTAPAHNVWRAFYVEDDVAGVLPSSGTSYAVALTAGIACLWLEHHGREKLLADYPNVPLQEVFRKVLKENTTEPPPHHDGQFGTGIVNARLVLEAALPEPSDFMIEVGAARTATSADTIAEVFEMAPPEVVRAALGESIAAEIALLDSESAGVEDELLFHIVTTPRLRNALVAAGDATEGTESSSRSVAQTFRDELAAASTLSDRLRARLNLAAKPQVPAGNGLTSTGPAPATTIGDAGAAGTVYALLVGIDNYPDPRHRLRGCVNDIEQFEQFLVGRVGTDVERLSIKKLTDGQATRQAVIDAWRNHLGQARANDVALFYYSGHGSQAPSPKEFWPIEPDKLDEGLVCWDSRSSDWDLADKELAQLIGEVAQANPHIVVMLDCCHSGSGTRTTEEQTGIRRLPTDRRQRSIEDFIVNAEQATALNGIGGDWISVPNGRHVVLSACQPHEEAREIPLAGRQRGVFSYYLLDTLQRTGRMLSYRELFKRVNALVRAREARQAPMMEATFATDLHQPFLGGLVAGNQPWFTAQHVDDEWWLVDGGEVHGIHVAGPVETTWLTIFPLDTPDHQLRETNRAVGRGKVVKVEPTRALLQLVQAAEQELSQTEVYKAVVAATPLPKLPVRFEGDAEALDKVRAALAKAGGVETPSPFVEEADMAALRLIAEEGVYRIQRVDDAYKLVVDTEGFNETSAGLVVQRLEHIARWQTLVELDNKNSELAANAVQMEIISVDDPAQSAELGSGLHLTYRQSRDGDWRKPRIRIRLTNQSNQKLHCAVLFLSQTYGVFHIRSEWLTPNNPPYEIAGSTEVLDKFWEQGVTTFKDTFKVIVSTEEMDATLAAQDDLPVEFVPSGQTRGSKTLDEPRNTLERLLNRVNFRHFEEDDGKEPLVDWMTSAITVTTTRPKLDIAIRDDQPSVLNEIVTIAPHPTLHARARLNTFAETRSAFLHPLPPLLRDHPATTYPLELTPESGTRGGVAGATVLELFDVENHEAVSDEMPLIVHLKADLADSDLLLPIAHDDEFYLPLGFVQPAEDGGYLVRLERLPPPTSDGSRAITNSIRILFQKLVGQRLGFEYHYPQLAAAEVAADGSVNYNAGATFVAQKVKSAERILLYIHGIFGSTNMLAASAAAPGLDPALQLAGDYDLILTYDYESVHTTIEKNGADLFARLSQAGLEPGHGKRLDIVAHSMGGLVARWMIEHVGGSAIVSHLMTVASPHAGSPWSTVQDVALVALTVALNGMTTVSWPLRAISMLVQSLEKFDVTLDEMKPGSQLLDTLATSPDPHVPYTLVTGDTALIVDAAPDDLHLNRLQRVLRRLRPKTLKHDVASIVAFFGEPNDMAVSVQSARAVAANRVPPPTVVPSIGVDHVSFFSEEAGLQAIVENLR